MPSKTWQSCFQYINFINFFLQLPPFASRPRLAYLTCIYFAFNTCRVLITAATKTFSMLTIFILVFDVVATLKIVFLIAKNDQFQEYFEEVDRFLKDVESCPMKSVGDRFFQIWERKKPLTYIKWLIVALVIVEGSLIFEIFSRLATEPEKYDEPIFPSFCPYFASSLLIKWLYTVFDCIFDVLSNVYVLYDQMTFLSLIRFQTCQLNFLKELTEAMKGPEIGKNRRGATRWWINCHQTVLRLSINLKELLEVLIAITYVYLIVVMTSVVMWIVTDLEHGIGVTLLGSTGIWWQLIQFGVLCDASEKFSDAHESITEDLYSHEMVFGERWEVDFLKVTTIRAQKGLYFTGLGLFKLSTENYKDLVMAIYSFLTSCLRVMHRDIEL